MFLFFFFNSSKISLINFNSFFKCLIVKTHKSWWIFDKNSKIVIIDNFGNRTKFFLRGTNYKIFYFLDIISVKNIPPKYFGDMGDNVWRAKTTFTKFTELLPTKHMGTLLSTFSNVHWQIPFGNSGKWSKRRFASYL